MKQRKFKHLSPADEAIVMHKADNLLEQAETYEIGPEGQEVHRPECPRCGGPGDAIDVHRYICMNCDKTFTTDQPFDTELLNRIPARGLAPRPKASFYPSGGASGGAGVSGF